MADPFLGEIRMFTGDYAPAHWALCNGQQISISGNEGLFSLLGARYGGDGRVTFALPDMRGRVPMHQGAGLGLTPRSIGYRFGVEKVAITETQMPNHTHRLNASQDLAVGKNPDGLVLAKTTSNFYDKTAAKTPVDLSSTSVGHEGAGVAHYNMQPYTGINFIISLSGQYPSRN